MLNQKILNSVGECNYNQYMLITDGKEVNEILNSNNSIFELYKYRDELLDKQILNNIKITIYNLKVSLEKIFLDYLSDSKFKIVKDILINHRFGWSIQKLLEIHKKHKGHRIFRILSIEYKDWLN